MAVNEACQNAIEHAYGLTPEPFNVVLDVADGEVVRHRPRPRRLARPDLATTAAAACRSCAR